MSKKTSNRNSTNYEAALSALKAALSDLTPFEQYPDYEDSLECIRDSLYRYYAEQRIPVYTAVGKKAEEAENKLHEKIRACSHLQHKEEGDAFPVSERLIEDINYVIGGFEEVALMEGVKIGMRLLMEAIEA